MEDLDEELGAESDESNESEESEEEPSIMS
jgi:hypothetical protein